MSFDKVKAMRNAERFLAQGKIRAAISEYKHIIESDPTDYNTMNMLGDLYAKATEVNEAVNCFTQVAEHYSKQGFSQKAIAIYNKISRLKPDSLEVSSKLAQLYQMKGSIAEAKTHYATMAEQYSKLGKKAEALMVWKQIASLDPNNTDIYLKIADACWQDNQKNEAAQAYIEAGNRLVTKKQYESAVTVFARALEIRPDDIIAMKGFVDAQIHLGYADEAAKSLEESLERQPYNREMMLLLADCHLEVNNYLNAEKVIIKLVEQEPSNYPKLLDLVKVYLKQSDLVSAARPLSMASEHMLVGGQSELLENFINQILIKDPEQLDALRLLVRYHTWQRDEAKIKDSLERFAEAARINNLVDDEKYAISQLIMISPQSAYYAQRLHELNSGEPFTEPVSYKSEIPTFESFSSLGQEDESEFQSQAVMAEYATVLTNSNGNGNGHYTHSVEPNNEFAGFSKSEFKFADELNESNLVNPEISYLERETDISENLVAEELPNNFDQNGVRDLSEFERHNLQKEIEGVDFYVAQGFVDLASKALNDIEERFGQQPEIDEARRSLNGEDTPIPYNEEVEVNKFENYEKVESEFNKIENNENIEAKIITETVEDSTIESEIAKSSETLLDDIKSEFGINETRVENEVKNEDFETSYQTGIVYKEMGLLEDAIREFQNAVKMTSPTDPNRRFYWCCNLLGHCFIDKQMPNIALIWFKRGLEAQNLSEAELQGLHYEIGEAYEKGGDIQKAIDHFEQIYAFDVSFRDVGKKLGELKSK